MQLVKGILALALAEALLAMDSLGCFSEIDTSVSKGFGQYQTQSECSSSCGASYPYVAIINGGICFCLSSFPTSNQVDASKCNVPCNGFGQVNCGGAKAYTVFQGAGRSGLVLLTLLLSSTALSSSTSAPANSATSSSTTSGTSGSVVNPSIAQTSGSATATSLSKLAGNGTSGGFSKVGPIVGGLVGGLAALVLIGVGVFFFLRRRKLADDDADDEKFYRKGASTAPNSFADSVKNPSTFSNPAFDRPMSNPFVHPSDDSADRKISRIELTDPRLNPILMGSRPLSEGSLADEADYSRKILTVHNP